MGSMNQILRYSAEFRFHMGGEGEGWYCSSCSPATVIYCIICVVGAELLFAAAAAAPTLYMKGNKNFKKCLNVKN
jgi:hypothetical protein